MFKTATTVATLETESLKSIWSKDQSISNLI